MASLFDDTTCWDCDDKRTKCKGCACDFFSQIQYDLTDFCSGNTPTFVVLMKGTDQYLQLPGSVDQHTRFKLLKYDPDNCCAVLLYTIRTSSSTTETRRFIVNCEDIAGITCVS